MALDRTLKSLEEQEFFPRELIVVDSSEGSGSKVVVEAFGQRHRGACRIIWTPAQIAGAAAQRNQGVAHATESVIWFFDDDILLEPACALRLWSALQEDEGLGGVSAMISNQSYQRPGALSRLVFRWMAGERLESYAGKVLGPAINLLPQDRSDGPEVVPVEWLNLGCTMYRRSALPTPPFPAVFRGYSLMEDLALSVSIGRAWKLANVRTARIFHDSQPGSHKADPGVVSEMALANRFYIMTTILQRSRRADFARLFAWTLFMHFAALRTTQGWKTLGRRLRGELRALRSIRALAAHNA